VHPRIYLKVAHFLGSEPELDRAIAAYKGVLSEAAPVFDSQMEQPFGRRPAADFASLLILGTH
jgi:hypothetical protein